MLVLRGGDLAIFLPLTRLAPLPPLLPPPPLQATVAPAAAQLGTGEVEVGEFDAAYSEEGLTALVAAATIADDA